MMVFHIGSSIASGQWLLQKLNTDYGIYLHTNLNVQEFRIHLCFFLAFTHLQYARIYTHTQRNADHYSCVPIIIYWFKQKKNRWNFQFQEVCWKQVTKIGIAVTERKNQQNNKTSKVNNKHTKKQWKSCNFVCTKHFMFQNSNSYTKLRTKCMFAYVDFRHVWKTNKSQCRLFCRKQGELSTLWTHRQKITS